MSSVGSISPSKTDRSLSSDGSFHTAPLIPSSWKPSSEDATSETDLPAGPASSPANLTTTNKTNVSETADDFSISKIETLQKLSTYSEITSEDHGHPTRKIPISSQKTIPAAELTSTSITVADHAHPHRASTEVLSQALDTPSQPISHPEEETIKPKQKFTTMASIPQNEEEYYEACYARWDAELLHGRFDYEPFLIRCLRDDPAFKDLFVVNIGMDPLDHVPGIPSEYIQEFDEKRIMYTLHIPPKTTAEVLRNHLKHLGTVVKAPALTDVASEKTFQWIVMSTAEEAENLFNELRFVRLPGTTIPIQAIHPLGPGQGIVRTILEAIRSRKSTGDGEGTSSSGPRKHAQKVKSQSYSGVQARSARIHNNAQPPVSPTARHKELRAARRGDLHGKPSSHAVATSTTIRHGKIDSKGKGKAVDVKGKGIAVESDDTFINQVEEREGPGPSDYSEGVSDAVPDEAMGPLLAKLKQSSISQANKGEASASGASSSIVTASPNGVATTQRKTSKTLVAVPVITTPLKAANSVRTTPAPRAILGVVPAVSPIVEGAKGTQAKIDVTKPDLVALDSKLSPTTPTASATPSSWAAIAGTAIPENKVVDIAPANFKNPLNRMNRLLSGAGPSDGEPHAEQLRVVFILNVPATFKVSDISNAIRGEGAVHSIQFGIDDEEHTRFAAIVFQHASESLAFVNVLLKERADGKPCRFKFIVDAVRAEEGFPLNDVLRAMNANPGATRRLTLVRSNIFSRLTKAQLRKHIDGIVGEDRIQILHLYNLGNATVVFHDVESAIKVKNALESYAITAGEKGISDNWKDLQVSYSKDPCSLDKPLRLETTLK